MGLFGVFQPFADGFKLLSKETIIPYSSNVFIFLVAPLIIFTLALLGWAVIPFSNNTIIVDLDLSVLFIFAISTLGVYSLIMAGWASNSKYAFLGALRSSAQLISYEIFMLITLLPLIIETGSLNLIKIVINQQFCFNFFVFFPSFMLCFIAILAETIVYLLIFLKLNLNLFLVTCWIFFCKFCIFFFSWIFKYNINV